MSGDRRIEIVRHLSEDELNRLLSEADDDKIVRRLTFIKNLYAGDTLYYSCFEYLNPTH